ncbi:unnamed protein product [Caenorhabditis angaria]|uniref:TNFR-Cys domain-containing protein n=1 Tax=Caenorhabditis angaria TaxID=860376 RepID=A0A9P1IKD1_9PELO|nr:unnamed protein product [Caenorhabditis angaria]
MKLIFAAFLVAFWAVQRTSASAGQCQNLYCPNSVFSNSSSIDCNSCNKCLDSKSRFCFTKDHKTCQCATQIDKRCSYQKNESDKSLITSSFCHLLDDFAVPPPLIKSDEHTVTATIPRFFQDPPYDTIRASFLYLLASFSMEKDGKCETIGHIEGFHRNFAKCLLRIRLHMPKIDYNGKDNYYYDDKSDIESQFSRQIFGTTQNVTFWTEITLNKEEKLPKGSVTFSTVQKSPDAFYVL